MAFQLSPGVNVSEIDLTTIVPSTATSIGAFAGIFNWGPVNDVTLVTDEVRLVERFGKPDSTNYEHWFSVANFLAYTNNLKLVRAANTSSTLNAVGGGDGILIENELDYNTNHASGNTTIAWAAKYPGALGNSIKVSVCGSSSAFSSNVNATGASLSNQQNAGNTTVYFTASVASNVVVGDLLTFSTGDTTTSYKITTVNTDNVYVTPALTANIVNTAIVTRSWEYSDVIKNAPGTSDYATLQGGTNDELHVVVVDEDGKFSGTKNTVLERFEFLSKGFDARTGDGSTNYYKEVINSGSRYVWWMGHQTGGTNWGNTVNGTTFTNVSLPATKSLTNGADGTIGNAEILAAYDKFVNPDEVDISLLISGPANATIANYLIDNIATVRKDCVAFFSPEKADVVSNVGNEAEDVIAYRDTLTSSSYGVMDCNWKYQFDKYNNVYRWIPLNGDIAGLCARTDTDRDPWFSPGGLNRGIIKNVVKLAWNPVKAERDDLYVNGVNPVVTFPGEGTVLFGDKTLQSKPSAFDRINVRRLFIILEKSIARAARYSLFEFNDQFTRAQFVSLVEPYLRDIQGRRGIYDFRVVCDETNNTGEVIDRNEFIGDIYIKPARSINFIQLNFVAVRTGVSFDEIVGKF
jgi:hypothetical protein